MPPKASGKASKKDDAPQPATQEQAAPPAVPGPVAIAPNSGKTTAAFSYKAMLTKSVPPAAPAAGAATGNNEDSKRGAVAAPPLPELVDLPAAAPAPKPEKKARGARKEVVAAVEEPSPASAAAPEEVRAAQAQAQPTAEDGAASNTAAPTATEALPEVVVESATPTTVVQPPSSPEKIAADEEPRRVPPPVVVVERKVEPREDWAASAPGYSTFSDHNFFTDPVAEIPAPPVEQHAAQSNPQPTVAFRNGHHVHRRFIFAAPTNVKVVMSIMAALRTREEEVALREDGVRHKEDEIQRREAALRSERDSVTVERSKLAAESRLLQDQKAQYHKEHAALQLQQQQHQQQQAQVQQHSQQHHHHHHHRSSAPSQHHGGMPPSGGMYGGGARTHGGHAQAAQEAQMMSWVEDDYGAPTAYDYSAGSMIPQQQGLYPQPRNYGRPAAHGGAPRGGGFPRMNMQNMQGYPLQAPPLGAYPHAPQRGPRTQPMQYSEQYTTW